MLNTTPPILERELGIGDNGIKDQTVGLDKATKADMGRVEVDLKQNPPQKFDIARTICVFNAHFEFVEFEMTGTHIGRKTMPIPAELMGLAKDEQTKRRLKANFRFWTRAIPFRGNVCPRRKRGLSRTTFPCYQDTGTSYYEPSSPNSKSG